MMASVSSWGSALPRRARAIERSTTAMVTRSTSSVGENGIAAGRLKKFSSYRRREGTTVVEYEIAAGRLKAFSSQSYP